MDHGAGLHLDAATLLFSIAVLAAFMAAIAFSLSRGARESGLWEWGVAMLCGAGAFLLFYLRPYQVLPWLLTYLGANVLVFATAGYCLRAYARLLGMPTPIQVMAWGALLGLSGVYGVELLGLPQPVSVASLSLGLALQFGWAACMITWHAPRELRKSGWMAGVAMGMVAVTSVLHAVLAAHEEVPSLLPGAYPPPQLAALLISAFFCALSTTAFIAMVNERHRHEIVNRLCRDGLTGLYTRTAFFEMVEEINRVADAHDYAVVMLDIDHFKSINDRFGHAGGDAALAHAARLLAASIRVVDIAVRYGGEEFCLLLKNCTEAEAARLAQRLVREAAAQRVRLGDGRQFGFTYSAGYAAWSAQRPTETLEEVIQRADEALYRAKHNGRNQAVAAMDFLLGHAMTT